MQIQVQGYKKKRKYTQTGGGRRPAAGNWLAAGGGRRPCKYKLQGYRNINDTRYRATNTDTIQKYTCIPHSKAVRLVRFLMTAESGSNSSVKE